MAVDLSASTPPPAHRPKPPRKQPARKTPKPTPELRKTRVDGVSGIFQIGAGLCVATGNMPDGVTIAKYGPQMAEELAKIAETDPRMAKVIDMISQAGPYAGLVSVMSVFGLQLAVNHQRIPIDAVRGLGVVEPDKLIQESIAEHAEALAQEAERAAEAEQRRTDAEQRLADLRQDHADVT